MGIRLVQCVWVLMGLQAGLAFFAWPNALYPYWTPLSAGLAFLVPVPFLLIIQLFRGRKVFFWGGLSGILVYLPVILQLTYMTDRYPIISWLMIGLAFALVWPLTGGMAALTQWCTSRFRWLFPVLAAVFFTVFEFLVLILPPYLWFIIPPGILAAYPLASVPTLIQMASFTGYPGVAFMLCLVAATLAFLLYEKLVSWPRLWTWFQCSPPHPPLPASQWARTLGLIAALGALLLILTLAGNWEAAHIARLQKQTTRTLTPALLQSNFDPSHFQSWSPRVRMTFLDIYQDLALAAAQSKAELVVMTEGAVPGLLPNFKSVWDDLREIYASAGLPALIGMVTVVDDRHTYNVWYQVDAHGGVVNYYVKQYLIPFGEYMPWRGLVDLGYKLVNAVFDQTYKALRLTALVNDYFDITPGKHTQVFEQNGRRFMVAVCDEIKFPQYTRAGVHQGAELVISPATGNWFHLPDHFQSTIPAVSFRAVETRRWVCRVMNMASAFTVDALGQVRETTPFATRKIHLSTVPLLSYQTFYVRFGDVFGWLCVLIALAVCGWILYPPILARFKKPPSAQSK